MPKISHDEDKKKLSHPYPPRQQPTHDADLVETVQQLRTILKAVIVWFG